MTDGDSWQAMLAAVQAFHDKHDFRNTGGEELAYRVALMSEELGEISSCVNKGKDTAKLAGECADLLILLIGTAIAAGLDLNAAFWSKLQTLAQRESRMVNARIRVSDFRDVSEKSVRHRRPLAAA
jgi:NTP pyrophosphatase (non-canonical NTP hydrolase)